MITTVKRRYLLFTAIGVGVVTLGGIIAFYSISKSGQKRDRLFSDEHNLIRIRLLEMKKELSTNSFMSMKHQSLYDVCTIIYSTCFVFVTFKIVTYLHVEANGTYDNLNDTIGQVFDKYIDSIVLPKIKSCAKETVPMSTKTSDNTLETIWQHRTNFENKFVIPPLCNMDSNISLELQHIMEGQNFKLAFTECANLLFDLFHKKNCVLLTNSERTSSWKTISFQASNIFEDIEYIQSV
ncbi:coenzyme Q-binding protein B, mitochondrial [Acrasis kona]|uniref:Coenzyme Q-binding protein B, mitochondrial n=1 Tax=Acrasis kona TaxID=1008807 RepID=A0AAW2Z4P2_9EUKA